MGLHGRHRNHGELGETMGSISKFCERMRYWCDEGDLGYDQSQRWNICEGGECDCSC